FLENLMDHLTAYRVSRQFEHQSAGSTVPTAGTDGDRPQPTLSGFCKLEAGRAVSLHARQAGVLRITRGRVWLTFNLTNQRLSARTGDHFLSRGESLQLAAGETVVMESSGLGHAPSAYYSWEPGAVSRDLALPVASGWRAGVLEPWLDVRRALRRLAGGLAAGVVVAGVGLGTGFATIFVAARARGDWADRTFRAKSSDTCADCSSD
ncbi:MAG: DUF2917 domain-containing protein, partial [Polaromonas sp.]